MPEFTSKFQIGDTVCSETAVIDWARGSRDVLEIQEVSSISFNEKETIIRTKSGSHIKEKYLLPISEAKSAALKYLSERIEAIIYAPEPKAQQN